MDVRQITDSWLIAAGRLQIKLLESGGPIPYLYTKARGILIKIKPSDGYCACSDIEKSSSTEE